MMATVKREIAEDYKIAKAQKNLYIISMVIGLVICVITSNATFAISAEGDGAKIYQSSPNKRLDVDISDTGVNRIEIKKDRIAKVVGNEGEYGIEGDNKTGVIFLSSKGVAGQILPITIITEKGYTQDVNLKIKKAVTPKSIIITKPIIKERQDSLQNIRDLKSQVIEAIKDVSSGEDRNYTRRVVSAKEIEDYIKRARVSDVSFSTGENKSASNSNKSGQTNQILNSNHNEGNANYRERTIYYGSYNLRELGVEITEVTEYTNRELRIYKYEYEAKPSEVTLAKINAIFKDALSTSERGNTIIVVYKNNV